jgi:hypothetical protein
MQVCSKKCGKCFNFVRKGLAGEEIPEHERAKNHDGSSKGMAATAALQMAKRLFERDLAKTFAKEMVTDDDASARALLSHCLSELAKFAVHFQWPVDSHIPTAKRFQNQKTSGNCHLIIQSSCFWRI